MAERIPMVALRAFDLNGVAYQAGDVLKAEPVAAATLNYQRQARFANSAEKASASVGPETPVGATPPKRRPGRPRKDQTYLTRDLTAKKPDRG